jgi:hypothetical protein
MSQVNQNLECSTLSAQPSVHFIAKALVVPLHPVVVLLAGVSVHFDYPELGISCPALDSDIQTEQGVYTRKNV